MDRTTPQVWYSPSSPQPYLVSHNPLRSLPSPERSFRHLTACDDFSELPADAMPLAPISTLDVLDALIGDMACGLAVGGNDDSNLGHYLDRLRLVRQALGGPTR